MHRGNTDSSILRCPFCETPMGEPQEIMSSFGNIISGGKCQCGAAFVYDRSGHKLGDAYVDALALLCEDDMEKAWSLVPEKDYEVLELSYNTRRNKFGREAVSRGRPSPMYLFVRLKK